MIHRHIRYHEWGYAQFLYFACPPPWPDPRLCVVHTSGTFLDFSPCASVVLPATCSTGTPKNKEMDVAMLQVEK